MLWWMLALACTGCANQKFQLPNPWAAKQPPNGAVAAPLPGESPSGPSTAKCALPPSRERLPAEGQRDPNTYFGNG
jgi:hypothetical protein